MSATPEQPYRRVLNALQADVENRRLKPGDRYPSISDLVEEHHVAPTTARRALTKLQEAGLAEPRHGVGWFVTTPAPPPPSLEERVTELERIVNELRERVDS